MRVGRVAIGVIAAAALLSGCAQQSEGAVGVASAAHSDGPGVVAFLEFARTAGFLESPKADDKASADRKARVKRDSDELMLEIGNAVCQIAAGKETQYGQVVQEVIDHGEDLGDSTESTLSTYPVADLKGRYADLGIAIDDSMTYQRAEDLVRASVPNLCPTYAPMLPGYRAAT